MTLELLNTKFLFKHPRITHEGFLYHFHKKCTQHIRWKCNRVLTMKCPSVLRTTSDLLDPQFIGVDHDHVHDNDNDLIAELKEKLMSAKEH